MSFPALHVLGGSIPTYTRDQMINIWTHGMQGLIVQTSQFGQLPWWDAALPWLNSQDRQTVYAAKHAKGDRHQLIALPSGPPLYNESNQSYSPDKFGPLDWTNNNTSVDPRLNSLITEVLENDFIPVLFLNGDDGEAGYQVAIKQLPLVVNALGPLMNSIVVVPGWDGVFYGYTPDHVVAFGQLFRQLVPNGYLAIEMSEGHIPLGEGVGDWTPTGRMKDYDSLLVEFNPDNLHQDSTWQISARLLGPKWHRPSDEPSGDDTNPPWYLGAGSPRGPFAVIPFEYDTYPWVRGLDPATDAAHAAYLASVGWTV